MFNPFKIFKFVGKLGKIENAVQQTKDVYEKVEEIVDKYKDVDDDVKALGREVREAKDAITGIFG